MVEYWSRSRVWFTQKKWRKGLHNSTLLGRIDYRSASAPVAVVVCSLCSRDLSPLNVQRFSLSGSDKRNTMGSIARTPFSVISSVPLSVWFTVALVCEGVHGYVTHVSRGCTSRGAVDIYEDILDLIVEQILPEDRIREVGIVDNAILWLPKYIVRYLKEGTEFIDFGRFHPHGFLADGAIIQHNVEISSVI
ncbi:hypothetical protein EDD15DRAFT_2202085 [Pisolithus albus]|nr:hypothetical protein EDD15DRAFT_2202085 [Pisolithus albus]